MRKGTLNLLLAVIWGLGAWAWTANLMRYTQAGTMNGFHIFIAAGSGICCLFNLLIYFRVRKKEKQGGSYE